MVHAVRQLSVPASGPKAEPAASISSEAPGKVKAASSTCWASEHSPGFGEDPFAPLWLVGFTGPAMLGPKRTQIFHSLLVGALIERDDAGTAQAEVVLQGEPGVRYLTRAGLAAQLLDELGTLGEARGTERVTLGQQAARRIGDDTATVGVVALGGELVGTPFRAQS